MQKDPRDPTPKYSRTRRDVRSSVLAIFSEGAWLEIPRSRIGLSETQVSINTGMSNLLLVTSRFNPNAEILCPLLAILVDGTW